MTMKGISMPAGEFKARCLQLMAEVERTRRPVTITKRGRPAAARRALRGARGGGGLAVAEISLYGVARLFALGHLRGVATIGQAVRALVEGVTVLPPPPDMAAPAISFPRGFPRAPADR